MSSRASIAVHALQLVYVDAGVVIGEIGPLSVIIWRGEVTELRFQRQRDALADVCQRYRPNAAFLCVVEEGAPPPSASLRKASAAMMGSHNGALCCAVALIEGGGFKAAVTRSVLIGITTLLGTTTYPSHYAASLDEAAARFPPHLTIVPKSLLRDIAELRSIMDAKGPLRVSSERRL